MWRYRSCIQKWYSTNDALLPELIFTTNVLQITTITYGKGIVTNVLPLVMFFIYAR